MPREQKPSQKGISFLVDNNIHKELARKAKENNMSLANYLVFCGMNAEIKVAVDSTHKNNTEKTSKCTQEDMRLMEQLNEVSPFKNNTVSKPTGEDIVNKFINDPDSFNIPQVKPGTMKAQQPKTTMVKPLTKGGK